MNLSERPSSGLEAVWGMLHAQSPWRSAPSILPSAQSARTLLSLIRQILAASLTLMYFMIRILFRVRNRSKRAEDKK